jgi:hypothetical protein
MIHLKSLILGAGLASVLASAFAVSAQVNPNGQPVPPPPPKEQLNGPDGLSHFQCYRIAPGPIGHQPVAITTTDQFGKQDIVLGQPIQICNPTAKVHKDRKFPIINQKAHLICYQIVKQPEAKTRTVDTRNQFYNRKYQTGARISFCAPSYKTLIGEKEFPLDG